MSAEAPDPAQRARWRAALRALAAAALDALDALDEEAPEEPDRPNEAAKQPGGQQ